MQCMCVLQDQMYKLLVSIRISKCVGVCFRSCFGRYAKSVVSIAEHRICMIAGPVFKVWFSRQNIHIRTDHALREIFYNIFILATACKQQDREFGWWEWNWGLISMVLHFHSGILFEPNAWFELLSYHASFLSLIHKTKPHPGMW